jgi:hypothetical protein
VPQAGERSELSSEDDRGYEQVEGFRGLREEPPFRMMSKIQLKNPEETIKYKERRRQL